MLMLGSNKIEAMELCLSKLEFYNCATDMNQITTLELFNYHFII